MAQIGSANTAGSQIAAKNIESLASKLATFSETAFAMAAKSRSAQAARDATIDVTKRKQKIKKIREEGMHPEMQALKIGQIVEGRIKSDDTIYNRAYNNSFEAAYANQIAVDAKSAVDMAIVQANGSSKAFMDAFPEYSQRIVQGAPSENLAIIAKQQFDKYGSAAYKSLFLEEQKKINELNEATYKKAIEQKENDFIQSVINGDDIGTAQDYLLGSAMGKNAMDNRWETVGSLKLRAKNLKKRAAIAVVRRDFQNAENKVKYIAGVYRNDDLKMSLSPEEFDKLTTDLIAEVDQINKAEKFTTDAIASMEKKQNKAAIKRMSLLHITGELKTADVEAYYGAGIIDDKQYKTYLGMVGTKGNLVDDLDEELEIRSKILTYTDDDIIKNEKLSNKQKISLLDFLGKESEVNTWTKTEKGKIGIQRVKEHFKHLLVPGFTGVSKKDIAEYNAVYNEYIDQMMKFKPEEREARAIPTANAIIAVHKEKEAEKKIAKANAKTKERKELELKSVQEYNKRYESNIPAEQKPYYKEGIGIFQQSFGNTGHIKF